MAPQETPARQHVVIEMVRRVFGADVNFGVLSLVQSAVEVVISQRAIAAPVIVEIGIAPFSHPQAEVFASAQAALRNHCFLPTI